MFVDTSHLTSFLQWLTQYGLDVLEPTHHLLLPFCLKD